MFDSFNFFVRLVPPASKKLQKMQDTVSFSPFSFESFLRRLQYIPLPLIFSLFLSLSS